MAWSAEQQAEASRRGGENAGIVSRKTAQQFYAPLLPLVAELRQQGFSLRQIAAELGRHQIPMRWGGTKWNAAQVRRILLRIEQSRANVLPDPHYDMQPVLLPHKDEVPPWQDLAS